MSEIGEKNNDTLVIFLGGLSNFEGGNICSPIQASLPLLWTNLWSLTALNGIIITSIFC